MQDFRRRFDVYPLIINADAATTTASNMTLYIYSAWQEIRLCNDTSTWTNWLPFQSTVNWTLPAAQGHHTVSAELRDGSPLALDLVPDLSIEAVAHKIGRISPRESQSNRLRKVAQHSSRPQAPSPPVIWVSWRTPIWRISTRVRNS